MRYRKGNGQGLGKKVKAIGKEWGHGGVILGQGRGVAGV